MTRWINIFILFVFLSGNHLFSQNIFDLEHSLTFADFLFKNKEYSFAAEEYERVLFFNSELLNPKIRLIQSYRFTENHELAIQKLHYYFPDKQRIPVQIATEYSKLLLLTGSVKPAREFLNTNTILPLQENLFYRIVTELMDCKYSHAEDLVQQVKLPVIREDFQPIIHEALNTRGRNPYLSMSLSAIIPGSGKAYAGAWKDGLFSLLFVGMSGWQSYRGFSKNGISSGYGWIFGSLSFGFYVGNLYGSFKAAKNYNKKHHDNLHHKVHTVFNNYY